MVELEVPRGDERQHVPADFPAGAVSPRLPSLDPELVDTLNALNRPRVAVTLPLGEREVLVRLDKGAEPASLAIAASIGEAPAVLHVAHESLAVLTAHLALHRSLSECTPAQRALWLEYALLEWIEPLEGHLGQPIQLLGDAPESEAGLPIRLPLRLEVDGQACRLSLSLGVATARTLLPLLDEHCPGTPTSCSALPLPLQWIAGYQDLTLAELRSLTPGDVVLLERPESTLAVAGRLMIRVAEKRGGLHLAVPPAAWHDGVLDTSPVPANNDNPQRRSDDMEDDSRKPAPPRLDGATLDRLPVRLVCELGRLELSLGEFRELDQGSVLPLSRPAENAVDIVVNGRHMGRGRLVEIGDSLGVQIVRLSSDE